MYYIHLLLSFIVPCYALNFGIPLPNTLILAGASSLVTWSDLGNATAVNLYLGNGVNTEKLTIIKIFGQNIASSKTSMWVTLPKDTPSDNTYLVLEGNDTPPSRATVPLNIGFGSKSTPPAVPTDPSSSSSLPSSSASGSSSHLSSSPTPTKPDQSSTTPSGTSSNNATGSPTPPFSDDENSANLSSDQAAGLIIGCICAAGLALGMIFMIRRKRRLNHRKRHTELFDEKDGGYHDYNNKDRYSPPLPPQSMAEPAGYCRSFGHTQYSAYYPMKTIDSTAQICKITDFNQERNSVMISSLVVPSLLLLLASLMKRRWPIVSINLIQNLDPPRSWPWVYFS